MAIAVVQTKTFNTSGSPVNVTFTGTPSVGNLIVVSVGGHTSIAVSDNQASGGNTYTSDIAGSTFGTLGQIWHSAAIAKASGTFTITITGSTGTCWGCIYEISGIATGTPNIRVASHNGGLSIPMGTGNTPATTENNAFVVAAIAFANLEASTVETVSPAWTRDFVLGSFKGEGDSRVIATTGVQACNWTGTSGANYVAIIAAFSDPITYTAPRVTQAVQSVVAQLTDVPIRVTQVVQGIAAIGTPKLRVTQVVQTLIVRPIVPPIPPIIPTPTNTSAWKLLRFDLKRRAEEEA